MTVDTSRIIQLQNPTGGQVSAQADAFGNAATVPGGTATGVLTSVASSGTSVVLLAANSVRTGAYFYNDSTAILYLALAATASTTAYTVQVSAQGFFEVPTLPGWLGVISGIWASANGSVRITELS